MADDSGVGTAVDPASAVSPDTCGGGGGSSPTDSRGCMTEGGDTEGGVTWAS